MQVPLAVLLPPALHLSTNDKSSWKRLRQFPHCEIYSLGVLQRGFVMVACMILETDLEISTKWQPGASTWHRMVVLLKDSVVSYW